MLKSPTSTAGLLFLLWNLSHWSSSLNASSIFSPFRLWKVYITNSTLLIPEGSDVHRNNVFINERFLKIGTEWMNTDVKSSHTGNIWVSMENNRIIVRDKWWVMGFRDKFVITYFLKTNTNWLEIQNLNNGHCPFFLSSNHWYSNLHKDWQKKKRNRGN